MAARASRQNPVAVLASAVSDAIIGIDRDGRICVFNPAAEQLFVLSADRVLGHRTGEQPETEWLEPLLERQVQAGGNLAGETVQVSSRVFHVRVIAPGGGDRFAVLNPASKSDDLNGRLAGLMREVVHGLKTPITVIKSMIELVEQAGPLTDSQLEFIRRAQGKLEYMIDPVHELLDMAWLGSGQALVLNHVDLNDLVEHTASDFINHIQQQDGSLEMDLAPGGCVVECEERPLMSAVGNLISNAIKYSPTNPHVRVVVRQDGNTATVQVKDNGLGIAPEHIPQLFEWFSRIRTEETWRIEGSGLGLAIVKAVIEKHGGQVFIESVPGQGSTFGFTLPVTQRPDST